MAFKFNPFTGTLDVVEPNDPNFSYTKINTGDSVTIPEGQEMVFEQAVVVDGTLTIDGAITQLVNYTYWAYSWNRIASDVSLLIPQFRDMLVVPGLTVDGSLAVDGRLIEVD